MDYVALGRTGIRVSQLCFGTMSFGGDADRDESQRMFAACRDAGINFFDCANVYNAGLAEEILGELMAAERNSLVITSKCVQEAGPDTNDHGASRRHIMLSVETSLKRLRTDRLDVLFIHRWDGSTATGTGSLYRPCAAACSTTGSGTCSQGRGSSAVRTRATNGRRPA